MPGPQTQHNGTVYFTPEKRPRSSSLFGNISGLPANRRPDDRLDAVCSSKMVGTASRVAATSTPGALPGRACTADPSKRSSPPAAVEATGDRAAPFAVVPELAGRSSRPGLSYLLPCREHVLTVRQQPSTIEATEVPGSHAPVAARARPPSSAGEVGGHHRGIAPSDLCYGLGHDQA